MSKGGAAPSTPLTGWVFFDRHRQDGFTIRWRRSRVRTPAVARVVKHVLTMSPAPGFTALSD